MPCWSTEASVVMIQYVWLKVDISVIRHLAENVRCQNIIVYSSGVHLLQTKQYYTLCMNEIQYVYDY